jgi:hypothetical protein
LFLDEEQRSPLNRSKLRKILYEGNSQELGDLTDTSGNGIRDNSTLWVIADGETPEGLLGASLLELTIQDNLDLVIYFENLENAQVTQRRVSVLNPAPSIFFLSDGKPVSVEPASVTDRASVKTAPPEFDEMCLEFGLEAICECGIWKGEILGLEVMRVSDGEIEVGVGKFDREANLLIGNGRPLSEVLSSAVEIVRSSRNPESGFHPLSRLVRERWLRADAVANPKMFGFEHLTCVDPLRERDSLREKMPAAAAGIDKTGKRVLLVFSVGVDVCLIPFIADLVSMELPDRVEVVLPEKDILVPVEKSLGYLDIPLIIKGVVGGWETPTV